METFSFLTGRYAKVENLVLAQRFCQHNFAARGHDCFGGEAQTQSDKIVLDLHPSHLILCASSINTLIPILLHKHLNQWILQSPNSWRDIALGYNPTWLETTAFKCLFSRRDQVEKLRLFFSRRRWAQKEGTKPENASTALNSGATPPCQGSVVPAGAWASPPRGKASGLSWWSPQPLGSAGQQRWGGAAPGCERWYRCVAGRNELGLTLPICLCMAPVKQREETGITQSHECTPATELGRRGRGRSLGRERSQTWGTGFNKNISSSPPVPHPQLYLKHQEIP